MCGIFVALSMGISPAASPPTIDRIWSWNIGATTAGLSMSFRNQDQNSRVWFEYSTDRSLSGATRAGEKVVSPVSGGVQAHATLSGLQPNTVYFFRGFVRNYDGEIHSGIDSFRTAAGDSRPPAVGIQSARQTGSSIEFSFTCDNNGPAATCVAFWSTSPGMSGKHELVRSTIAAGPTGSMMHATFRNSTVPDDTRIYVQAEITSPNGTAKTAVRDFLVRNKPI